MKDYRMIFLMFLLALAASPVIAAEETTAESDYCRLLVSSLSTDTSTKETYTKSSVSVNYYPADSFFDIFTEVVLSTADTNQDEVIDKTEFLMPADSFFDIFIEISGVTRTECCDSFFDIFVDVAFSKIDANLDGMIDKTELSLCCGDSFFDIFVEIEIDLKGTLGDTHIEELELAIEKVEKAGIYLPDVCPDTDNDGIIDGLDNCPAEQVVRVYDASGNEVYELRMTSPANKGGFAVSGREGSEIIAINVSVSAEEASTDEKIEVTLTETDDSGNVTKARAYDGLIGPTTVKTDERPGDFDAPIDAYMEPLWITLLDKSTSEITGYLFVPQAYNPDQSDIDKDGMGDVCDSDADGDAVEDIVDNCMGMAAKGVVTWINPPENKAVAEGKHDMAMAAIRNIKMAIAGDNVGMCIRGISKEDLRNLIVDGTFVLTGLQSAVERSESGAYGEENCIPVLSNRILVIDENGDVIGYLWVPQAYNPDQSDIDSDGLGDVCDVCPANATDTCDPTQSAARTIGTGGGTLTNAAGTVEINIPENALAKDTSISIAGTSDFDPKTPYGEIIGLAYDFGPSGIIFSEPVTIRLYYNPAEAEDPGIFDIFYFNADRVREEGIWQPQGATLDETNSALTIKTDHFSRYALGIKDVTPPEISLSVSPTELWPANHQMVEITVDLAVRDDYDPNPTVELKITSNEPDDAQGNGDGNTVNDIQIIDSTIFLRAERAGNGNGRTYTITYTATDISGNSASKSTEVFVPHDWGNGKK